MEGSYFTPSEFPLDLYNNATGGGKVENPSSPIFSEAAPTSAGGSDDRMEPPVEQSSASPAISKYVL